VKTVFGVGLLVVGFAGLVLPIIPGIPILLAGAAVLGHDHKLVRPWMSRIRKPKT